MKAWHVDGIANGRFRCIAAVGSEILTGSCGRGTLSDDRPLPGRENPPTTFRQSILEGASRVGAQGERPSVFRLPTHRHYAASFCSC